HRETGAGTDSHEQEVALREPQDHLFARPLAEQRGAIAGKAEQPAGNRRELFGLVTTDLVRGGQREAVGGDDQRVGDSVHSVYEVVDQPCEVLSGRVVVCRRHRWDPSLGCSVVVSSCACCCPSVKASRSASSFACPSSVSAVSIASWGPASALRMLRDTRRGRPL